MKSLIHRPGYVLLSLFVIGMLIAATVPSATAQNQAKRLILKDGTYQLASRYEVKGDRVRYLSAERGEWEEIPKSLIDWDATDKFEQNRVEGAPSPEAVQLDKDFEAEQKAEEARSPQIAPGLRLPPDGGIFLLDTYQNQAQLDELQQAGGELNANKKSNILRSTINPLASVKQTIELPGQRARIQSHTTVPSIYISVDAQPVLGAGASATGDAPLPPPEERFKIVRVEIKNGKRIAGAIKVAPIGGKIKADERFVPATVTAMSSGWIKLTPKDSLPTGEYAIAEMLGKEGMNLYVWDFGVNPNAAANASAIKPDTKHQ